MLVAHCACYSPHLRATPTACVSSMCSHLGGVCHPPPYIFISPRTSPPSQTHSVLSPSPPRAEVCVWCPCVVLWSGMVRHGHQILVPKVGQRAVCRPASLWAGCCAGRVGGRGHQHLHSTDWHGSVCGTLPSPCTALPFPCTALHCTALHLYGVGWGSAALVAMYEVEGCCQCCLSTEQVVAL